jgi:hypothetical protein
MNMGHKTSGETPSSMGIRYVGLVVICKGLPWWVRRIWMRGVDLDAEGRTGHAFYREQADLAVKGPRDEA